MARPLPRCRLSRADYDSVIAEYARAAARYDAHAAVDDDAAIVVIRGSKPDVKGLLDAMVEREGQCCSQFRFAVDETHDGYRVELSMPGSPGPSLKPLHEAVAVFFPSATIDGTTSPRVTA